MRNRNFMDGVEVIQLFGVHVEVEHDWTLDVARFKCGICHTCFASISGKVFEDAGQMLEFLAGAFKEHGCFKGNRKAKKGVKVKRYRIIK